MKIDGIKRLGREPLAGITLTRHEEARARAAGHALASCGLSAADLLRILSGLGLEIARLDAATEWTTPEGELEEMRTSLFKDACILYTAVRLAQVYLPQTTKG